MAVAESMVASEKGSSNGSSGPVLAAKGLRKVYGHVQALRGVDLELFPGEVHALVGDNGAGKSTLLRILAGATEPDGGELSLHGQPVRLDSPLRARELGIETVYQDLALANDRSCSANVYIGRELRRAGPLGRLGFLDRRRMNETTRQRFAELSIPITQVERPVRLLSGGQRQGVAIARAAIWAKHVLLLDEPTAALGVRQRHAVAELIERLRELRLSVVLISHDIPEVLKLADRVTVLRLGQRVATRDCEEVDTSWVIHAMVEEPLDE
ncbi:MAG TPA: ATP-binding cassette domain-containing protein [Solirubrobacterales bacterium]|nr:ATP-binding cassette domain-containing protein [Solirubrobacterales bacterium]